MKLYSNDTNELVEGDASPELCSAACESEHCALGMWSDTFDQWVLIDESQVATLRQCRPEPRIVAMYGLP
jgi:hypothetical protein